MFGNQFALDIIQDMRNLVTLASSMVQILTTDLLSLALTTVLLKKFAGHISPDSCSLSSNSHLVFGSDKTDPDN